MGVIEQGGVGLLSGSIYDNIVYSLSCEHESSVSAGSAKIHMDRVIEACQLSNAHDFIMSFPDQYNTVVCNAYLRITIITLSLFL